MGDRAKRCEWHDVVGLDARLRALARRADLDPAARAQLERECARAGRGWYGEELPARMRVGEERLVYEWDTGHGLTLEMVYVPPGDFIMGPGMEWGWWWDEGGKVAVQQQAPAHVRPMAYGYWIGRTPITWRDYRIIQEDANLCRPKPPGWRERRDHPVVGLLWCDAKEFCLATGTRLPTEAEWEKAARGTDGRTFPWGEDEPTSDRIHWNLHGGDRDDKSTTSVHSCAAGASPYGALHMLGNVFEYCADLWDPTAYARHLRGKAPRRHDPDPSPWGPRRVVRGGGEMRDGVCWPIAYRSGGCREKGRNFHVGFRPVVGPRPPSPAKSKGMALSLDEADSRAFFEDPTPEARADSRAFQRHLILGLLQSRLGPLPDSVSRCLEHERDRSRLDAILLAAARVGSVVEFEAIVAEAACVETKSTRRDLFET